MSAYDLTAYGTMIADAARCAAYREALRRNITPRTTVLDLGTGTGIHALMACRLGAARVFAVETADVIQIGREVARDNGFGDRITFLHEASTRVQLPCPADLIVSDLRGVLPMFGRHIPTIIDARSRLLGPGGTLIPARDELCAAPVEAPDAYHEIVSPWSSDELDLSAARRLATQTLHRRRIEPEQLLAPPHGWGAIDYSQVDDPNIEGRVTAEIERSGHMHGIAAWFEGTLAPGIRLSNAPGGPPLIYGQAFFPLPEPVPVAPGDRIDVSLRADLVGTDYIWTWATAVAPPGSPEPGMSFRQSTFHGAPLSPRTLMEAAADHVPSLRPSARIDLEALAMIDGRTSLGAIAERLAARHPEAFADVTEALDRVAALSRRDAE